MRNVGLATGPVKHAIHQLAGLHLGEAAGEHIVPAGFGEGAVGIGQKRDNPVAMGGGLQGQWKLMYLYPSVWAGGRGEAGHGGGSSGNRLYCSEAIQLSRVTGIVENTTSQRSSLGRGERLAEMDRKKRQSI